MITILHSDEQKKSRNTVIKRGSKQTRRAVRYHFESDSANDHSWVMMIIGGHKRSVDVCGGWQGLRGTQWGDRGVFVSEPPNFRMKADLPREPPLSRVTFLHINYSKVSMCLKWNFFLRTCRTQCH